MKNNFICKKCENKNNFFRENKGNQIGLYCSYCGHWVKWLSKEENRLFDKEEKEKEYAKGFNDGCAKFSVGQDFEDGYKQAVEELKLFMLENFGGDDGSANLNKIWYYLTKMEQKY